MKKREEYRGELRISKKFGTFWNNYRQGVGVYYLMKGSYMIYSRSQLFFADKLFACSVLLVTCHLFFSLLVACTLLALSCACACLCSRSLQNVLLGCLTEALVVLEYLLIISITGLSAYNTHRYFLEKDIDLLWFFCLSTVLFGLLIVKDFLDMCWIKTVVSDHVFRMDLQHYLFDEKKIQSIRDDISLTRKIQIEHGVDVNVKDQYLPVLFDEQFSEENISKYCTKITDAPHLQAAHELN